jgi:hypothetical protein
VIARPSHWRTGPNGREPVAGAGDAVSLSRHVVSGATTGRITSRPAYTTRELEVIAYRLGVTVAAVKRAIALGLLETFDATDR